MSRKQTETDRRQALNAAPPERRHQAYNSWLEVATGAEVRRHWRAWMGVFPGWAESGGPPYDAATATGMYDRW